MNQNMTGTCGKMKCQYVDFKHIEFILHVKRINKRDLSLGV